MLNTIKLYHWTTTTFAQHKATDELHEKLSGHIDKFIEILIGKLPTSRDRVRYGSESIPIYDCLTKDEFIKHLERYTNVLIDFTNRFNASTDSDLLNIRDEMLGDINQTLYLFSLE
jgi:hypothetical protein